MATGDGKRFCGLAIRLGLLLAGLFLLSRQPLLAQEWVVSYGQARGDGSESSDTWAMDMRYPLTDRFLWSLGYLNELSIRGYHRDGFLTQGWVHWPFLGKRLDLAAGIGPYFSDDTQAERGDSDIEYALGFVTSVDLTGHVMGPWLLQLSYNHVETTSYDSDGLLLGVGAVLPDGQEAWRLPKDLGLQQPSDFVNEITPFLVRTFINGNGKPESWGAALEYRRFLAHHVEGTLLLVDEGDSDRIHRRGAATQLWLLDRFFRQRLILGAGLGPYLHGEESDDSEDTHVAALISATAAWRLSPHWTARFNFNRVVGDYHLNADVLMLGVGYRWGPGRMPGKGGMFLASHLNNDNDLASA